MNEISYPYDGHPKPGQSIEIKPGLRWVTMPMGGSLTHINLYLIEDQDGWYVVDTGLNNEEVRDLWSDVFRTELGGKTVKGVICTHMHPDHTGQAKSISDEYRAPLYMTRAEYYHAVSFASSSGRHHQSWMGHEFYVRAGMSADYMQQLAQMWSKRSAESMTMPEMPAGYHRLEDNDVLHIGGREWRVVVGSGHSPEHACLYCQSLEVMISGDQILPIITSNVSVHPTEPEANPLKVWMESHDKFLATPAETLVLPAHNLPFYGVRPRLRELIHHHDDRMLAIEEACVEPQIAKDLLPVLFARKLDARQTMMALGEAIAHLHLLMHREKIERTIHADGHYRFTSLDPKLDQRSHPHHQPHDSPQLV